MKMVFENRTPPHHKFYRLRIERGLLFVTLERRWGRIGSRGRRKVECFQTETEARKVYQALCRLRERHGYVRTEHQKAQPNHAAGKPPSKNRTTSSRHHVLPLFKE